MLHVCLSGTAPVRHQPRGHRLAGLCWLEAAQRCRAHRPWWILGHWWILGRCVEVDQLSTSAGRPGAAPWPHTRLTESGLRRMKEARRLTEQNASSPSLPPPSSHPSTCTVADMPELEIAKVMSTSRSAGAAHALEQARLQPHAPEAAIARTRNVGWAGLQTWPQAGRVGLQAGWVGLR